MLIYTGKFEDLEKYGYKNQALYNTYIKCINGYFLYVEITCKETELRERILSRYADNNVSGEIHLCEVNSNYTAENKLSDEECIKYITDLIEDDLVIQCELINTITATHIMKLHKQDNYIYREENFKRKNRGDGLS